MVRQRKTRLHLAATIVCLAACTSTCRAEDARQRGEELLRRVAARYDALRTLSCEMVEERTLKDRIVVRRGIVRVQKPDLARIDFRVPNELVLRDGVFGWRLERGTNRFWKTHADRGILGPVVSDECPVSFFFSTRRLVYKPVAEHHGTEMVNGVSYEVVEATLSQGRQRLYIGDDLLIHRITGRHGGVDFTSEVSKVVADAPSDTADFVWTPPPGARRVENPAGVALVPAGTRVPNLRLKTFDGRLAQLENLLKGRKALLLHVWSYP